MTDRTAALDRRTSETQIEIRLDLDGTGQASVTTGIGFLDHLLTSFARHSRVDLGLECQGDIHIDDHHTAEDCGIMLGKAVDRALGKRTGIGRFGDALAPLDESLARAVVDISGRGGAFVDLQLQRESIGAIACENIPHVLQSFAVNAGLTLHVDVIKGENDHHRAEAAFKAFALAFRAAIAIVPGAGIQSTKELIERGAG